MVKIQESGESYRLEQLRTRIAENSQSLIGLFRERANLAREIGLVKKELGLPSRIREREEFVLDDLGDMDSISRSIISSLFEYSIVNEENERNHSVKKDLENQEYSISGSRSELELFAGLMISRPGVDVYSKRKLPETLSEGIQVNGGHIIMGECEKPDITICLGSQDQKCDFAISDGGKMTFSLKFPIKSGDVLVKVVQ